MKVKLRTKISNWKFKFFKKNKGKLQENEKIANKAKVIVKAPASGEIQPITNLNDEVFSKKILGDGVFIKLACKTKKQEILAPISGELVVAFPAKHAYGIKTESGFEILLHIGLDTINLSGKGFKSFVKQGQRVVAGDLLVEVNTKLIASKVPSFDPIIIITSGQKVGPIKWGDVIAKDKIFESE